MLCLWQEGNRQRDIGGSKKTCRVGPLLLGRVWLPEPNNYFVNFVLFPETVKANFYNSKGLSERGNHKRYVLQCLQEHKNELCGYDAQNVEHNIFLRVSKESIWV